MEERLDDAIHVLRTHAEGSLPPGMSPVVAGSLLSAAAAAAAMMYGGRPSTGYPSVNPAAMMAARSPHMPHQTGLQQVHGRRGRF